MKILIADDTIVSRRILETLLGKDGHTVVLAEDGKQAVALFEQEQPDLVIMDLMMPEMDGYQATKLIKQQTGSRFVPVIFLTAVTNEDVLAKCIAHGGDDFLTKPYNHTILRAKIAAWERIQNLHATVTAQKDELEGHHARFLHEQDVASTIRNNVLGGGCLDQIGINYHLAPAATLSGDLILAATHPTGVLHLMIGDFTGHGLSAAIGALPVADIFYRMTERGFTLRDILIKLNRKLKRTLPTGLFCAASLVELDARRGSAAIWNGGLPDVLVFNSGAGCRLQSPIPASTAGRAGRGRSPHRDAGSLA
jgi:CheY-like chemotaxis protein